MSGVHKRSIALAAAYGVGLVLYPSDAQAYLDAGTGSMLVQILAAGIAGAAVVAKLYWRRLKGFFAGGSGEDPDAIAEPTSSGQSRTDDR
jgi:hypothetical protein